MEEFRVPSYVTITFFQDSAVLLDLRKNVYHALNDTAADFWKLLTQTGSCEDALQKMLELYQDSPDIIRRDVQDLVFSLAKVGLLEPVIK
ncbi:PqqD family protein [Nostoc sp. PA-18-2419]|uniref:PqqD family protein n=1 Tax=Nostoc sp. PA-18-2419 TaxID=2575443 RepID=UPI0011087962|nr:PqqD family protein [Nostoc sp. PA-18-2419]